MPSAPAVTIVVASYNYAAYLAEALHSALNQSFGDFELLVVDDASTDNSLDVARRVASTDARVRVLTHADNCNHGLPAVLALGLQEARGRWTAFLEADDYWHPHCLAQRLAVAEATGAQLICNDIAPCVMPGASARWFMGYVPRVMRWHERRTASAAARGLPALSTDCDPRPYLLENKIPTFSCVMVHTAALRRVDMHPPVPRWLDWWVWTQLAAVLPIAHVPHKLTHWRLHPKSWHHKVHMPSYLQEYRRMGQGFQRLLGAELLRRGQGGAALFLRLPASLRLLARLLLPLREEGPLPLLRRIVGRVTLTR